MERIAFICEQSGNGGNFVTCDCMTLCPNARFGAMTYCFYHYVWGTRSKGIIRKMIINFMLSGLSAIKLNDHLFQQQFGLFCGFCESIHTDFLLFLKKKCVEKKHWGVPYKITSGISINSARKKDKTIFFSNQNRSIFMKSPLVQRLRHFPAIRKVAFLCGPNILALHCSVKHRPFQCHW